MQSPTPPGKHADHRVQVAQVRRERMRQVLLDAVRASYSRQLQTGNLEDTGIPTVDEVITVADVSRASFYKYFPSVEAAIEQVGAELVDEMVKSLARMHGKGSSPTFRFLSGVHLFLWRATIDPAWAAFVARSDVLQSESNLFRGISAHLNGARSAGELAFEHLDAARTIAIGTLIEAFRRLARIESGKLAFVEEVSIMIYMSLGMTRERARASLDEVVQFVRSVAPARLSWWRDA